MEDVMEADEREEFDVASNSTRKIKIKTQVFVHNSNQESPNIADHLSSNMN